MMEASVQEYTGPRCRVCEQPAPDSSSHLQFGPATLILCKTCGEAALFGLTNLAKLGGVLEKKFGIAFSEVFRRNP